MPVPLPLTVVGNINLQHAYQVKVRTVRWYCVAKQEGMSMNKQSQHNGGLSPLPTYADCISPIRKKGEAGSFMLIDPPCDYLVVILITSFLRALPAAAERPELWSTL